MKHSAQTDSEIPKLISASALAKRIGVSRGTVRNYVQQGTLPGVVLKADPRAPRGGVLLIPVTSVLRFLREQGIEA